MRIPIPPTARLCVVALLAILPVLAMTPWVRAGEPGTLEVVARFEEGPGNLTVKPDGTVVMSLHPFFSPQRRVVEVQTDGSLKAYPDAAWAKATPDRLSLDAVLGIQADRYGIVWMLDNGLRGSVTPKLVAWDGCADSGVLSRVIHLPPPATRADSFVNDLAIDRLTDTIVIADPAGGKNAALIVVDLDTGRARRVLEGHVSVVPEDVDLLIDGKAVEVLLPSGETIRPHVGVNPIALDAARAWLYYGPMHGTSLYRVRMSDLQDETMAPTALAARVERYASKPICDGISMDEEGNVYITDVGSNAIGVITTDRTYRILVQDDTKLSWPDAISFGPDGKLYTVSNQLHRTARLNGGEHEAKAPFHLLRIEPLARGTPGR